MLRVLVAKAAEFFNFHTVWVVLLFLGGVVVALLAFVAGKGYF